MRKWYQYRLADLLALTVAVACALSGVSLFGITALPFSLVFVMPFLLMWVFRLHPWLAGAIGGALGGFFGAGVVLLLGHKLAFGARHPPAPRNEVLAAYTMAGILIGFALGFTWSLLVAVLRAMRRP